MLATDEALLWYALSVCSVLGLMTPDMPDSQCVGKPQ